MISADENEQNMVMIKQTQQSTVSHPPARSSLPANSNLCSKGPEASQGPEVVQGLVTTVGGEDFPCVGWYSSAWTIRDDLQCTLAVAHMHWRRAMGLRRCQVLLLVGGWGPWAGSSASPDRYHLVSSHSLGGACSYWLTAVARTIEIFAQASVAWRYTKSPLRI